MSFKPNSGGVDLCNRALSRLSQEPINSLEPPTPQGKVSRACERWYRPTVARLLEMHHWGLARRRVASLTALANDRTSEWLFKFQLPVDVAFPVNLAPMSSIVNVQYYQALGGMLASLHGQPIFLKVGRAIYSRYTGGLDYVSYDITEAEFNATFENIVELTLAAAMAYDLTKSRPRETDLREQATSAINIAIAQDLNTGHPRYGDSPTERDIVRGAGWALPWDWWPGPQP
jgi:hypothetical protein